MSMQAKSTKISFYIEGYFAPWNISNGCTTLYSVVHPCVCVVLPLQMSETQLSTLNSDSVQSSTNTGINLILVTTKQSTWESSTFIKYVYSIDWQSKQGCEE